MYANRLWLGVSEIMLRMVERAVIENSVNGKLIAEDF